jgi:hypothetical protein
MPQHRVQDVLLATELRLVVQLVVLPEFSESESRKCLLFDIVNIADGRERRALQCLT